MVLWVLAPPATVFHSGTTVPDFHSPSLHVGFATEGAGALGMLADFNFLHHFPEGSTIAGPVFTNNPDLFGAFGHVPTT
jgi:hypothetical protein